MDIRFHFSQYTAKSGTAGLYGNCVRPLEELLDHLPKWLHHFTFPSAVFEVPISPYPCQYLLLSVLLIIASLVGVKWHLFVASELHFLMANDVEHLLMCLLAICMSSLEKCLFRSLARL